ncbi:MULTISPECIES: deoxyribose-phosphate aldolase [unclassified Aureispira]|uniref:deoxyribose-phosphate aldolase n=1 Tax=unclassified Aureispira TaxID=2649989 RepID=UPI000698B922|nr:MULTISPECIES: deoxyribose-phosphate aldolase [unclassified Aureispira]WMX14784.1 deoxyribose-phosphate aldolase [Aureispira sp. CCB-E]
MELNNYIEYTLLKPDTTKLDIKELCREALEHNFSAVCIPPFYVPIAAKLLEDSNTKVITTIGYPMGYHAIPVKVEEAKRAIDEGVDEIEMMVNIAAVKDGNWSHVKNDISSVTTAAHLKGKKIKVILETSLLTIEEIKQLCAICCDVEVDCIKNATGVNGGHSTIEMINLLKTESKGIKIVVAGGVHTKAFALELIEAGVDKLGTPEGVQLLHSIK